MWLQRVHETPEMQEENIEKREQEKKDIMNTVDNASFLSENEKEEFKNDIENSWEGGVSFVSYNELLNKIWNNEPLFNWSDINSWDAWEKIKNKAESEWWATVLERLSFMDSVKDTLYWEMIENKKQELKNSENMDKESDIKDADSLLQDLDQTFTNEEELSVLMWTNPWTIDEIWWEELASNSIWDKFWWDGNKKWKKARWKNLYS